MAKALLPLLVGLGMSVFVPCAAQATDVVVVLQWPATQLTFGDETLQRKVVKRLRTRDLEFRSGEGFDVRTSNRQYRVELVAALSRHSDLCEAPLQPRHTNVLKAYYEAHGPYWIVVPEDGKLGRLSYWRWRPDAGVSQYTRRCERKRR